MKLVTQTRLKVLEDLVQLIPDLCTSSIEIDPL
jgi:hypothetical protein